VYAEDGMTDLPTRLIAHVCLRLARRWDCDPQAADDAVQEGFLRVLQWLPTAPADAPARLLAGVARRGALDAIRTGRVRVREFPAGDGRRKGRELLATDCGGIPDAGADPWAAVEARDAAAAVGRLPEPLRAVVALRFGLDGGGGRTALEIAAVVGAPVGTVKTRLRGGLECLRA
jgi:RNA polymerase sigma-70 factor (ECF subfamily)